MLIGLDIDDTICNTHFALMRYAIKYNLEHGNKPFLKYNTNNFGEVYGWNDEEVYNFFRTYYLKALDEVKPKFMVKEVLTKLREEGNKIIFITVRNDRECGGIGEAERITKSWLDKYKIPYDELYLDVQDKASFCKEHKIELFIDDSIRNVKAVNSFGINACLAVNPFNMDFEEENITNIYSMDDFYSKVHEILDSNK